jgi:hypothetical protein
MVALHPPMLRATFATRLFLETTNLHYTAFLFTRHSVGLTPIFLRSYSVFYREGCAFAGDGRAFTTEGCAFVE